jgi:hypothetical protein
LAEFLIDAHGSALEAFLIRSTVHFLVIRHKVPLKDLHELEGDDEADRDEGAVEDEVGAKRNGCDLNARRIAPEEIVLKAVEFDAAVVAIACAGKAAEDLKDHDGDNVFIDSFLDVAGLVEGSAAVHHDRSLLPDVYH